MQRPSPIRIGTRKSTLALAQAEIVRTQLHTTHPEQTFELVPMATTGDRITDRTLADAGGKGLFTKELEEGLLQGDIDLAVHSLKDMQTALPEGLIIGAVLERGDPRDALVTHKAKTLARLPVGARVGTSSLRRAAQLKIIRPDLIIVPFRGNVTTRLAKLEKGEVDATVLALAGLTRIGMEAHATEILDTERFIPAVGQGIIALQCREDDKVVLSLIESIHHSVTHSAALAERALLAVLDGSCRTPIGGYARMEGSLLRLDAMIATPDGSVHALTTRTGNASDAIRIGEAAAEELLARGGRERFA